MLKFNSVPELKNYAKYGLVRTPTNQIPKSTDDFRITYVDFCLERDVGLCTYSSLIGVGKTTPYGWLPKYNEYMQSIHEEIQQEEHIPLPPKEEPSEAEAMRKIAEEALKVLAAIELLHSKGYVITKGQ